MAIYGLPRRSIMNLMIVVFSFIMILLYFLFNSYILKYEKLMSAVDVYARKNYNLSNFSQYISTSKSLKKKYWIYEIIYILFYIVSLFIFSILLALLAGILSDFYFSIDRANLFIIKQDYFYFILGFLFLSISFGFIIPEYVIKLLLKKRFIEFKIFQKLNRRSLGTARGIKIMFIIICICSFVFTFLILNWYVRVDEENIYVNSFLSLLEVKYDYSEIEYLRIAEKYIDGNGKSHDNLTYTIGLNDEENKEIIMTSDNLETLTSVQYVNFGNNTTNIYDKFEKVLEFLSQKSKIPIERRQYIEEFK